MLSYISAENSLLRSLGNRCLLLVFLCILTRTGQVAGKASAFGISLEISQGTIVVWGPILAFLILASSKLEADSLVIARRDILEESRKFGPMKVSPSAYGLFVIPTISAVFFVVQFFLEVVPAIEGCSGFRSSRYLWDMALFAQPTTYCIRDITENMPWIYPPFQTYAAFAFVVGCAWLSYSLSRDWKRYR